MTHLLVHNGHYSCAESHSNNHDTDEVLVKADGLDHCYHKDDQYIHVALPLVFRCVKINKLNDESVIEGNKHILTSTSLSSSLSNVTLLLFSLTHLLVQVHILPASLNSFIFSVSLPLFINYSLQYLRAHKCQKVTCHFEQYCNKESRTKCFSESPHKGG